MTNSSKDIKIEKLLLICRYGISMRLARKSKINFNSLEKNLMQNFCARANHLKITCESR